MRCRDCGEDVKGPRALSKLYDVCDSCWENRIWVTSGAVPYGDEFIDVQRAMESRSGGAKHLIEALKEIYA